ncbi:MAG: phosphoserine phosphatase SerB [Burkholderiales bacterium]
MSGRHLVLQGLNVARDDIDAIAKLTQAQEILWTKPNVCKLLNALPHAELEQRCQSLELDYAFIPADLKLSDVKLVAMDMDSTLINIESLDEIADYVGLKQEVAAITQRSMQGEVDFSESLLQRVALLKGLDANALERVYLDRVQLNPGAEQLIAGLQKQGIKTLLVSGGFIYFTERLKQRLNLDYAFANDLEVVAGKLTGKLLGPILDANAKARHVGDVCRNHGIELPKCALAIGDGANDRAMFNAVGIGIAYHAKAVLQQQATYQIDHVGLDGILNLFAS